MASKEPLEDRLPCSQSQGISQVCSLHRLYLDAHLTSKSLVSNLTFETRLILYSVKQLHVQLGILDSRIEDFLGNVMDCQGPGGQVMVVDLL